MLFNLPVIHTETGSLLFNRIYLVAFLVVLTIYFISAFRKKIPSAQSWLALTALVFFFILGTKIFALSPAEWQHLLFHGQWPEAARKTMLGGVTGLLFGIIVYAGWIRSHRGVLDIVALIIPVAMAIQRIGCLMSGCCFGNPTHLPWGICYSAHSNAWFSHLFSGYVAPDSLASLPVHPSQLYDILCWMLILAIVLVSRNKLRATGNRLLLTISLYGFFRFFLEFTRDPISDFIPGFFLGIKYIQWMILAGLPLLTTVILLRERNALSRMAPPRTGEVTFARSFSFSLFLILAFLFTRRLFDMTETLSLLALIIPLFAMTMVKVFLKATIPGLRPTAVFLAAGVVLLTSQTYYPEKNNDKVTYIEIGSGGAIGTFYNSYKTIQKFSYYEPGGCGDPGYWVTTYQYGKPHTYKHQQWLTGMDIFSKQNFTRNRRLSVGGSIFLGQDVATVTDSNCSEKKFTMVVNPSFSYDWRFVGIKGGLYLGKFYFSGFEYEAGAAYDQDQHTGELRPYYIFPQLALRVGPYDMAFLEFRLADHFPQGSSLWQLSLGFGTGLGKYNGTRIGVGISTAGFYADCYYPIKEKYVIKGGYSNNFQSGADNLWTASVGFAYRFGYKTYERE